MKKKLFFSLIFVLFFGNAAFCGILETTRTLNSISTNHFDIFFPKQSIATAEFIAQKSDSFFEQAAATFPLDYPIRILIVISPDSDTLDIKYTPSPYNRIIIYDSVPKASDFSANGGYSKTFESLLKREIYKAVASCVKNKNWQIVSKLFMGDSLQPLVGINMPAEFFYGCCSAAESGENFSDDFQNLSILSKAKLDGTLPGLFQLYGGIELYPHQKIRSAAMSAFCSFLMQKYGFQKFYEFWAECGKLHFFKLHKGIFKKVYGTLLSDEWDEFCKLIPLPEVKELSGTPFTAMNETVCKFLCATEYGFVWFDELKCEVDLYNPNDELKIRQLLFLADSVNNISVSPCGRFISVSYTQTHTREAFKKEITMLYDLKMRTFLRTKFPLRDSSIIQLENGNYAVAGISVKEKIAELTVYSADEINFIVENPHEIKPSKFQNQIIFHRSFDSTSIPFSIAYAGGKKIAYLLTRINSSHVNNLSHATHAKNTYLCFASLSSKEETCFQLAQNGEFLNPTRLYFNRSANTFSQQNFYLIDYTLNSNPAFFRTAAIFLDSEFLPYKCLVQSVDYSGGISCAVAYGEHFYFISNKATLDECFFTDFSSVLFEEGKILVPNILLPDSSNAPALKFTSFQQDESGNVKKFVNEHEIKDYYFVDYFLKGGWNVYKPVHDISLQKGVEKVPGFGVNYETSSDVLSENSMILGAGLLFVPLDLTKIFNPTERSLEELEKSRNDYFKNFTLSAYLENSSTPIDLSLGSLWKFNTDGEYDFKIIGGASYLLPLRMNFRKLTINLKGMFTASTTFWDAHQKDLYPNLSEWPLIQDSYRSVQALLYLNYTNIHQFGVSSFKKLGIQFDVLLSTVWDVNLFELQRKNGVKAAEAQTLNDVIKNQLWGLYAPTQINMGVASTLEIPHLLPFANVNNWILSFPSTLHAELFYTNGTALDVSAKILLCGKEIQNGWEPSKLYFDRAGLYAGYEAAFEYDTNTVVLPDLRDYTRFYTVFSHTVMNDSVFLDFVFHLTPVVGEFSNLKSVLNFKMVYYMHTQEFKVSLGMKFN